MEQRERWIEGNYGKGRRRNVKCNKVGKSIRKTYICQAIKQALEVEIGTILEDDKGMPVLKAVVEQAIKDMKNQKIKRN